MCVGAVPRVKVVQPTTRRPHRPGELRNVAAHPTVRVKLPHRPPRVGLKGVARKMPEKVVKSESKPPQKPQPPHRRLPKLPPPLQPTPVTKSHPGRWHHRAHRCADTDAEAAAHKNAATARATSATDRRPTSPSREEARPRWAAPAPAAPTQRAKNARGPAAAKQPTPTACRATTTPATKTAAGTSATTPP